jgi:hypothetical protein
MPTITFTEMLPNISKFMPIELAKASMPKWVKAAQLDFAKKLADGYPNKVVSSPHRCPGIVDLITSGVIVRAWHDIAITTNGDGQNFEWNTPVNPEPYTGNEAVGFHPPDLLTDYLPKRGDTLRTIIKLYAPWLVSAPDGYRLLSMPMAYSDDARFTNCPGILDTKMNRQLNLQLFWHVLDGTEVIRAGTPLAHLILIPDEIPCEIAYEPYDETVKQQAFYETFKHSAFFVDKNTRGQLG